MRASQRQDRNKNISTATSRTDPAVLVFSEHSPRAALWRRLAWSLGAGPKKGSLSLTLCGCCWTFFFSFRFIPRLSLKLCVEIQLRPSFFSSSYFFSSQSFPSFLSPFSNIFTLVSRSCFGTPAIGRCRSLLKQKQADSISPWLDCLSVSLHLFHPNTIASRRISRRHSSLHRR